MFKLHETEAPAGKAACPGNRLQDILASGLWSRSEMIF